MERARHSDTIVPNLGRQAAERAVVAQSATDACINRGHLSNQLAVDRVVLNVQTCPLLTTNRELVQHLEVRCRAQLGLTQHHDEAERAARWETARMHHWVVGRSARMGVWGTTHRGFGSAARMRHTAGSRCISGVASTLKCGPWPTPPPHEQSGRGGRVSQMQPGSRCDTLWAGFVPPRTTRWRQAIAHMVMRPVWSSHRSEPRYGVKVRGNADKDESAPIVLPCAAAVIAAAGAAAASALVSAAAAACMQIASHSPSTVAAMRAAHWPTV
jgi:hypothetical protein